MWWATISSAGRQHILHIKYVLGVLLIIKLINLHVLINIFYDEQMGALMASFGVCLFIYFLPFTSSFVIK